MVNNCGVVTDGSGDALLVDTTSTEKRNRALLAEVAGVAERGPRIAVEHPPPPGPHVRQRVPARDDDDHRPPPVPRGCPARRAQGDRGAARGLRRPGRPASGPHRGQRHHPAPRRVPGRAPGHGTRPLDPRHRRLAAGAEGLLRRRPGVLGRPPDLPRGLDGRASARPSDGCATSSPTPCSRVTVPPVAGTRWAGCSTTSRLRRLDRGDRPRVVRRRPDAAGGGPEARRRAVRRLAGGRARGLQPAPRLRRAGRPDYEPPVPLRIPALWPEMVALHGGPIACHA